MTTKQRNRILASAMGDLRKAAEKLRNAEFTLGNGAEADNMVDGIADEIQAEIVGESH